MGDATVYDTTVRNKDYGRETRLVFGMSTESGYCPLRTGQTPHRYYEFIWLPAGEHLPHCDLVHTERVEPVQQSKAPVIKKKKIVKAKQHFDARIGDYRWRKLQLPRLYTIGLSFALSKADEICTVYVEQRNFSAFLINKQ